MREPWAPHGAGAGRWAKGGSQGAAQSHSSALLKAFHIMHTKSESLHFQSRKRKINIVQQRQKPHKTKQGICFHHQKLNECKVISWLGRKSTPHLAMIHLLTKQRRKLKFFVSMPCYDVTKSLCQKNTQKTKITLSSYNITLENGPKKYL